MLHINSCQVLEAVAGLGKEFLVKLVTAWQELGSRSELIGDKVALMMTMMTMMMKFMTMMTAWQEMALTRWSRWP